MATTEEIVGVILIVGGISGALIITLLMGVFFGFDIYKGVIAFMIIIVIYTIVVVAALFLPTIKGEVEKTVNPLDGIGVSCRDDSDCSYYINPYAPSTDPPAFYYCDSAGSNTANTCKLAPGSVCTTDSDCSQLASTCRLEAGSDYTRCMSTSGAYGTLGNPVTGFAKASVCGTNLVPYQKLSSYNTPYTICYYPEIPSINTSPGLQYDCSLAGNYCVKGECTAVGGGNFCVTIPLGTGCTYNSQNNFIDQCGDGYGSHCSLGSAPGVQGLCQPYQIDSGDPSAYCTPTGNFTCLAGTSCNLYGNGVNRCTAGTDILSPCSNVTTICPQGTTCAGGLCISKDNQQCQTHLDCSVSSGCNELSPFYCLYPQGFFTESSDDSCSNFHLSSTGPGQFLIMDVDQYGYFSWNALETCDIPHSWNDGDSACQFTSSTTVPNLSLYAVSFGAQNIIIPEASYQNIQFDNGTKYLLADSDIQYFVPVFGTFHFNIDSEENGTDYYPFLVNQNTSGVVSSVNPINTSTICDNSKTFTVTPNATTSFINTFVINSSIFLITSSCAAGRVYINQYVVGLGSSTYHPNDYGYSVSGSDTDDIIFCSRIGRLPISSGIFVIISQNTMANSTLNDLPTMASYRTIMNTPTNPTSLPNINPPEVFDGQGGDEQALMLFPLIGIANQGLISLFLKPAGVTPGPIGISIITYDNTSSNNYNETFLELKRNTNIFIYDVVADQSVATADSSNDGHEYDGDFQIKITFQGKVNGVSGIYLGLISVEKTGNLSIRSYTLSVISIVTTYNLFKSGNAQQNISMLSSMIGGRPLIMGYNICP